MKFWDNYWEGFKKIFEEQWRMMCIRRWHFKEKSRILSIIFCGYEKIFQKVNENDKKILRKCSRIKKRNFSRIKKRF